MNPGDRLADFMEACDNGQTFGRRASWSPTAMLLNRLSQSNAESAVRFQQRLMDQFCQSRLQARLFFHRAQPLDHRLQQRLAGITRRPRLIIRDRNGCQGDVLHPAMHSLQVMSCNALIQS